MAYDAVPIEQFGGLNLAEPEEVPANQAINVSNIDLDKPGAIRVRDGMEKFNSVAGSNDFYDAFVWTRPTVNTHVIVSDATNLLAYNSSGTAITSAAVGATFLSAASLGTASAGPYLYIGVGTGASIRRWDGTNFSAPAGMPTAVYVATQPVESRLVAAYTGSSGGGTNQASVVFSDAGTPETWTAGNYVDLHPNDGGFIVGMVTWRDQVFVFKNTGKMFVFYGNSVDSVGGPVFNFRSVDMGLNVAPESGSVVAASDGVYFRGRDGMYFTTGGTPQKISAALDAMFWNGGLDTAHFFTQFDSIQLEQTATRPVVWGQRVLFPMFVMNGGTQSAGTLVYYRNSGEWSWWNHLAAFPGSAGSSFWLRPIGAFGDNSADQRSSMWVYRSESPHLFKTSPTLSTDNGTNFSSLYRSGFYSPIGSPSQECRVRESILEGIGSPSFSVSKDYGAVPTSGGGAKATVTLGTSPSYGRGTHRVAQFGRRFSWQAEAASGSWRINSIINHISARRPIGLRSG